MSYDFNPSAKAAQAFRSVMNNDRIIPLSGPSHIHTYGDKFHMADNLPGGAKIYYNGIDNGIDNINLIAGKKFNLK